MAIAGIPYRNDIAEVTASFPGAVWAPQGVQDRVGGPYPVDAATAVAPAVSGGKSILQLFYVPDAEEAFVATLGGNAQTRVAWGTTPGTGEYAVDFVNSRVEFPVAQAGETYLLTFTGTAVAISADLLNRLLAEVVATQATVDGINAAGLGLEIGVDVQAQSATLDTLAATTPGATGLALLQDATGADARAELGLGSLATADTVDNADWSGTALAVANGGTGATTAGAARTALDVYSEGEVDTRLAARLPRRAEITTVSANYTLLSSDEGKLVVVASTATVTIPTGLPAGWQTTVVARDGAVATVAGAGGVTLESEGGVLDGAGRALHIVHLGSEDYLGIGSGEVV